MNEPNTSRIISSRSLKVVAGGVSLIALALLVMLAVGVFSDRPGANRGVATSQPPNAPAALVLPSGGPALHAAIAKDDSELMRILVEGGADVDVRNRFGDPALHAAIAGDDLEMLMILVEAGANVDTKNRFGDPALHRAILKGDSEMVRVLVDAGANVNTTNAFGDSALSRAVNAGNKEILQILADAGGG